MSFRLLKKTVHDNFAIIDSQFPQKRPMGFRNTEINEYLQRFKQVNAYTMYPMKPDKEAWFSHGYGMDKETFEENKSGYLESFPQNKNRIHLLDEKTKYNFKMAYSFFLAETYTLLPFYEKNHIPFIFILYPGGAFGIDNKSSDAMLRKICNSPHFRGVIVSQKITKQYLLKKRICKSSDISYVYGGFVQFQENDIYPKVRYPNDKSFFDICFVAAKYTEKGIDKGYDAFIAAAKLIAKRAPNARFHVIGNFDEHDINVAELGEDITFYGYQKADFFPRFYARMDVMISPNRPGKLYEGNFDGFPLGVDAGYCGVAMFVSDELGMNEHFKDGEEIVIVKVDPKQIANKVMKYYNDTDSLYELSEKCRQVSRRLFSIETQILNRLKAFNNIYIREYSREIE